MDRGERIGIEDEKASTYKGVTVAFRNGEKPWLLKTDDFGEPVSNLVDQFEAYLKGEGKPCGRLKRKSNAAPHQLRLVVDLTIVSWMSLEEHPS